MNTPHIPVLIEEVLSSFETLQDGYFVDCTLGYAGHSSALLAAHPHLKHIGIDRDQEALDFSSKRLEEFAKRSNLYKGTFSQIVPTLSEFPIVGVLADFGVSSLQLDKLERGFGFESQVLDMRMDNSATLSAYGVVNGYSAKDLEYIFYHYGELKENKKIASAIIEARVKKPIESAKELSSIIVKALPKRGKIHPATIPFQAIRIEVNNELGEIEELLNALETMKLSGTIVSLITFHSLEDRLVKNRFREWAKSCICDPQAMRCNCGNNHSLGKIISRKPLTPSNKELRYNPRSRSAKLRTFQFQSESSWR